MVSRAAESSSTSGRRQVTPAAVRDAALTLFAEHGYDGTALSEIAAALGVRVPSLYNHMTSKQELLSEILTDTTERVWSEYEQAVGGVDAVDERLKRATYAYALRHATHRREALVVNRDIASLEGPARTAVLELRRRHAHAIQALIEEGVEDGEFDEDSARMAAFGILEMCVSVARWFRDDGAFTAEQVAERHSVYALRIAGARSAAR